MPLRPEFLTFEGPDGTIGALRWEGFPGAPTIIAIHGITANAWHFDAFAHRLAGAAHIVAVDLRGRVRSVDHPGPFGMRNHAADIAAIIDHLGSAAVLVGHSMGCYVSLMTAKLHPDLVRDLVLVDGGTNLNVDAGVDVDTTLTATLGPAIERLRQVWPDRVAYSAMWSQHPAFAGGISVELQRNQLADLVEVEGGFRTSINEEAVLADGRELFGDVEVGNLLADRQERTAVIHAPLGLDGAPPPLIRHDAGAALRQHHWIPAPGFNHYTVLLSVSGAQLVADTVRSTLGLSD